MPLTRAEARKIALSIAGTEEKPHFDKPAVFFGERFVARVHDKEEAVALRVSSIEMRDVMLEAEPKLFYITDHYKSWPMLLVRLKALDRATLKQLLAARIAQLPASPRRKRTKKKVAKKKKT